MMANGDGYGLSYTPYEYTTFNYPDPFQRINPPNKEIALIVSSPKIAINAFNGIPGDLGQLSNTSGGFENGHGETRSRFIWVDSNNVNDFVNYDVEDLHADDEPNYRLNVYWNENEVKPTGLLYINGKLYLACHRHDEDNAVAPAHDAHVFYSVETANDKLGEIWAPEHATIDRFGTKVLHRLDFSAPTWANYKFTTPAFIQFGEAYADFGDAFSSGNVPTAEQGEVYVYALSTHHSWWNRDELYLGRVKVKDGAIWTSDDIRDGTKWEYWSGMEYTDFGGQKRLWPRWVSDVDLANAVLHSDGEVGQASTIYHEPSGQYYMTTWTNSDRSTLNGRVEPDDDNPYGSRHDNRWFLWEADQPWGPWKKIFTNDYHGRQNDLVGVVLGVDALGNPLPSSVGAYGFMGYASQIMPTWLEDHPEGGWKIWMLQSGFWNVLVTGESPWLRNGNYTTEFIQLHIKPDPAQTENVHSIIENYQQNDHKLKGDLLNKRIGYLFEAGRNLYVTHLGRYYETGDQHDHQLRIVEVNVNAGQATPASGGMNASVTLTMNPSTGQMDRHGFLYEELVAPVQITKGRKYLLLSDESSTDYYYGDPNVNSPDNPDIPELKAGQSIDILNYAIETGTGSNAWSLGTVTNGTHPGNSMGLINMITADPPEPFAEASNLVGGDQASIYAGMNFTLDRPIVVTHLGRYKFGGLFQNQLKHEIKLLRRTNPRENEPAWAQVAWGIADMANVPSSVGFVYAELATPVRLEANEEYLLVSREYTTAEVGSLEAFYRGTSSSTWPILSYPSSIGIQVVGAGYFEMDTRTWIQTTTVEGQCYGPLNMKIK
jgi:hypothetical protein